MMPMFIQQESVRQKEFLFCETSESVNQQKQQYERVKEQRVDLQESIKSLVNQCNDLIQTENAMFRGIQQVTVKRDKTQEVLRKLNESLETCGDLVSSYNSFIKGNINYIAKINIIQMQIRV